MSEIENTSKKTTIDRDRIVFFEAIPNSEKGQLTFVFHKHYGIIKRFVFAAKNLFTVPMSLTIIVNRPLAKDVANLLNTWLNDKEVDPSPQVIVFEDGSKETV